MTRSADRNTRTRQKAAYAAAALNSVNRGEYALEYTADGWRIRVPEPPIGYALTLKSAVVLDDTNSPIPFLLAAGE